MFYYFVVCIWVGYLLDMQQNARINKLMHIDSQSYPNLEREKEKLLFFPNTN